MLKKLVFSTAAITITLLSGTIANAQNFDGVYSGSWDGTKTAMSCDLDYQGSDGGPIVIYQQQYFGVESYCDLKNPTSIRGIDGILYDAECSEEGSTSTSRMLLIRSFDKVLMHHHGSMRELFVCR